MKKLIMFLAGVMLLALMCGALFVSGVIYDTGDRMEIVPYMFRPNNLSDRRLGIPATVDDLGDGKIFQFLMRKYITEYFYAIPDMENIAVRLSGETTLARMSSPEVFAAWQAGEGEKIKELAENRSLRMAQMLGDAVKDGDYWVVNYETHTWVRPNDLATTPVIERGRLLIQVDYVPGFRAIVNENGFEWFLVGQKYDPALLFRFNVRDIYGG